MICCSCSFYDTSIKDREGNLIFKTEWIAPTIVDLDEIVDKCYDANKIIKKYADGLYYLGNDGTMKTDWISIDGAWYYFNTSGMLATDTVVDGYYVDSKGIIQPKEKQKVLLDNKYVKITYLGVDKNSNYFKKVSLQVENKSSQELIVQTDKVSIDDCMVYGMFSPDIMPGKIDTKGITFNSSSITTGFNSIQGEFKNYK